jgi:hypothetical protein
MRSGKMLCHGSSLKMAPCPDAKTDLSVRKLGARIIRSLCAARRRDPSLVNLCDETEAPDASSRAEAWCRRRNGHD